jgi:lipopolysaccharide/colanic/teichoic acid biosynthesis glycosyltransferase
MSLEFVQLARQATAMEAQAKAMESQVEVMRTQAEAGERAGRRAWLISLASIGITFTSLAVAIVAVVVAL